MRILCFSDVHGNVDAVKRMIEDIRKRRIRIDAIIFAGDLTSFKHDLRHGAASNSAGKKRSALKKNKEISREIIGLLTGTGKNVYFITGNRDHSFPAEELSRSRHFIDLQSIDKAEVKDGVSITASAGLIDESTIFVTHKPIPEREYIMAHSLLYVEGHTHKERFVGNHLNTGFLYRDSLLGAREGMGGYFVVEINDGKVKAVLFVNLGDIVKRKTGLIKLS